MPVDVACTINRTLEIIAGSYSVGPSTGPREPPQGRMGDLIRVACKKTPSTPTHWHETWAIEIPRSIQLSGKELTSSQVFLEKADLLSISDIMNKVNFTIKQWELLGIGLPCWFFTNRTWLKRDRGHIEVNLLLPVQIFPGMHLVHVCSPKVNFWFPGT